MKHPPYHLRHNKAVDRFLFIDLLIKIFSILPEDIRYNYTYHGFGGPFLEDFKIIHQNFPNLKMICIEKDEQTHKRQKFNLPNSNVKLEHNNFNDYFSDYQVTNQDIVWIDYTDKEIDNFEQFQNLIQKLNPYSIIKITLNADFTAVQYAKPKMQIKIDKFKEKYSNFLPPEINNETDFIPGNFPKLLYKMLKISYEKIKIEDGTVFHPLTSFIYKDNAKMLTLTGMLIDDEDKFNILTKLNNWKYFNNNWTVPKNVNVPTLSLKERIMLDQILPIENDALDKLTALFEFGLGDNQHDSEEQLKQYSDFYNFYPFFTRIAL